MNQSNLPTVQRLKYEDYADATDWKDAFQKMVNSLNLFLNPAYNILNGGVTYQNLAVPQLFTKVITGAVTTTFTFANPLTLAPSAVLVGNVWTGILSTHPSSPVQVFWHYTGGNIVVDNVTNLTVGTIYTLVLVIL